MAKKLLAILAALCLVAAMGSVGASAVLDNGTLYTSEYGNGEFHILVIPDAHQTADEDPNLVAYIESAIKYMADQNCPLDLVLFLGDTVAGSGCASAASIATAVGRLLAPVIAANIPYTLVFGNHDLGDAGGAVTGAQVLQIWKDAGGGLFVEPDVTTATPTTGVTNFKYTISKKIYIDNIWGGDTDDSVDKNGTPNVLKETVSFAQLFLFDVGSKDAGEDGYDYVRADQLAWFTANNNAALPAFVFQHIPLPEVYTGGYFLKTPFNWALPGSKNILGINYCGMANYVNMVGTVLEAPNPPKYSDGEFAAITATGNVKAAFFGHDHVNNFVEKFDKIDLVQLPGAAWNGSYGTYLVRGGSFVSIRPNAGGTGVTYGTDSFTYRQAARVGGSKVSATTNGFSDWIKVVPFLFQNLLINILAPIRWIGGGF